MNTTHPAAVSFRLDKDLQTTVKTWLHQHPSLNLSRLANMAIRQFVTTDQQLEKVEVVNIGKAEFKKSLKKIGDRVVQ